MAIESNFREAIKEIWMSTDATRSYHKGKHESIFALHVIAIIHDTCAVRCIVHNKRESGCVCLEAANIAVLLMYAPIVFPLMPARAS